MSTHENSDSIVVPPFETEDLRKNLASLLNVSYPFSGGAKRVGDFRWGVYAFYDYDNEPIYVGQTNEKIRTRIRRHLTNQRTDAVAMSVLDPFEVYEIAIWPLPQYQEITAKDGKLYITAKEHLNSLERTVYQQAVTSSNFKVVLNEKDPPSAKPIKSLPKAFRQCVVSADVRKLRSHPDFRIARRALVIARLAQVISERKVQGGLRRVMLAQAKRLEWLASRRYEGLGGSQSVERESANDEESDDF